MDAAAILHDPLLAPSVAWDVCKRLFGEDIVEWESDTFRVSLARKRVDALPGTMAKIMGAQTVVTTKVWTYDYDALFHFALACVGIPAASDVFPHPYSEQVAWAIREIRRLHPLPGALDDEGFDPDEIDPAIACVLAEEGFVLAPEEVKFAQGALDRMTWNRPLRDEASAAWNDDWLTLDAASLHGKAEKLDMADPLNVQLAKLAGVRHYVLGMETLRASQQAAVVL